MTPFRPTSPPSGRLARLGVVLEPDDRAISLSGLCDRAGIDIVWLADRSGLGANAPSIAVVPLGEGIADTLERAALGLFLAADDGPDRLRAAPGFVRLMADDRLEATWPLGASEGVSGPDKLRPRRSITVTDLAAIPAAIAVADDIVLAAWQFSDLEAAADEVRAEASEAGRDPATLGVAALVPVSIGRTQAEAVARVAADPIFRLIGHPAEVGIFGTLEECQDRVIALAHAGFTDLRCIIPATIDVHDVIAQLTAITIGTTDVLIPGSLRSPSPPPPDGWGGRSPIPDRPRVSDGSRRR